MKKLITALICAMMVLGVGGCGSKNAEPKDIYENLKDSGYKVDDQKYESSDSRTIKMSNGIIEFSYTIIGDMSPSLLIYDLSNNEYTTGVTKVGDNYISTISKDDCIVDYKTNDPSEDCNEVAISDIKDVKERLEDELDKIGTDLEGVYTMFEWYVDNNK